MKTCIWTIIAILILASCSDKKEVPLTPEDVLINVRAIALTKAVPSTSRRVDLIVSRWLLADPHERRLPPIGAVVETLQINRESKLTENIQVIVIFSESDNLIVKSSYFVDESLVVLGLSDRGEVVTVNSLVARAAEIMKGREKGGNEGATGYDPGT